MKIYWGFKDVPELAGLSRSARRKVVRACFFRFGYRQWPFWLGQLAIFVFVVLGETVGFILHDGLGFSEPIEYVCGLIGVLIGCLIYGLLYYSILMDRLRPHFREYIAGQQISN